MKTFSNAMRDGEETKSAMPDFSKNDTDYSIPMETEPYDPEAYLSGASGLFPNMINMCGSGVGCMTVGKLMSGAGSAA